MSPAPSQPRTNRGFTVVEALIVVAIVGVLVGIALPKYFDYRERMRVSQAIQDIAGMNVKITGYMRDNTLPPSSLVEVGDAGKLDPWGRPYSYLPIMGASKGIAGKARKNKNLTPLNSDFDLYSVGKDGQSVGPLTAGPSRDDVVRANDGHFIGLASDYE